MITIETLNNNFFLFNGVTTPSHYEAKSTGVGEDIEIVPIGRDKEILQTAEKYDRFEINGQTPANKSTAISLINQIVFKNRVILEGDPTEVIGINDIPYLGRGYESIQYDPTIKDNIVNQKSVPGFNNPRFIQKVDNNGTAEYWVCGSYMGVIKFNENFVKIGEVNMYGYANNTNHYIQYTNSFAIDYANNKIYFACFSRHVVRVYKFSDIRDNNFLASSHLYDIGVESGSVWNGSYSSSSYYAEQGHVFMPTSVAINPTNGHVFIACERGRGSSDTSSYQYGYIVERKQEDGSFVGVVLQRNGSYAGAINDNSANYMQSLFVDNGKLYTYCDPKYFFVIDIATRAYNKYAHNSPLSITGIIKKNDITGGVSLIDKRNEYGVMEYSASFNLTGRTSPREYPDPDQIGSIVSQDHVTPFRMQNYSDAINIGDFKGLGVGDWYAYITTDNNRLGVIPRAKVENMTTNTNGRCYLEIPSATVIAFGWGISRAIPTGIDLLPNGNAKIPLYLWTKSDDVTLLLNKE